MHEISQLFNKAKGKGKKPRPKKQPWDQPETSAGDEVDTSEGSGSESDGDEAAHTPGAEAREAEAGVLASFAQSGTATLWSQCMMSASSVRFWRPHRPHLYYNRVICKHRHPYVSAPYHVLEHSQRQVGLAYDVTLSVCSASMEERFCAACLCAPVLC
jgi:hypothetical protein